MIKNYKIEDLVIEHKTLNQKQNKTIEDNNRIWEIRMFIMKNHNYSEWENNYEGVNFNYKPDNNRLTCIDKLTPKIKNIKMTEKTLDILKRCSIEGMVVKLPNKNLEKNEYADVKKSLELIGGKWKGGKIFGFVFLTDPTDLLSQISNGEKRNLKKEFQFFGTPDEYCDKLVVLADIKPDDSICEPNAGQGAIIKAINKVTDIIPDCFELMENNIIVLKNSGLKFNLIGDDFFNNNGKKYDKIIANPPFSKNQDIDHIKEMYKILKKGGRLVSISSDMWYSGTQKKQVEFKKWLFELNAVIIEIPKGAFKESGTMVGGMIIVVNKPK
jgi:hypothetical protein